MLLSFQRALLGMVGPDLRGVAVWWGEGSVGARFIYESNLEARRDDVAEIETEIVSTLGLDFVADFRFEVLAPDRPIAMGEREEVWVFVRAAR